MRSIIVLTLLVLAGAANGAPFNSELREANELLRRGDVEQALLRYEALRERDPESAWLAYNLGCALRARAKRDPALFDPALRAFERVTQSEDPVLAREGLFNHATCLVEQADARADTDDLDGAIEGMTAAIKSYGTLLELHPGDKPALANKRYAETRLAEFSAEQSKQESKDGAGGQSPKKEEGDKSEGKEGEENKDTQEDQKGEGDPKEKAGDTPKEGESKESEAEQKNSEKQEQGASEFESPAEEEKPPEELKDDLLGLFENNDKAGMTGFQDPPFSPTTLPKDWW